MKIKGKKMIAVAIAIVLAVVTVPETVFAREDISKADLTISSVQEFKEFAEEVNEGNSYEGKIVRLTEDLDFSGSVNNFTTPIGSVLDRPFSGIFDGGNHVIRGISFINKNEKILSVGLFGTVSSTGEVKNLVLEDFDLEGYGFIAGAAVDNKGIVKNITLRDSQMIGIGDTGTDSIGGIVAENEGTIDNCHVENTSITGCFNIGGIVGTNYTGNIQNCSVDGSFQGSVTEDEFSRVGGIASLNWGNIYNCYNMATIESVVETGILGGIAGNVGEEAMIQNCYNVGKIGSTKNASGIAAYVGSKCIVANCYSLEGTSPALFGTMDGTDKNNKIMSQEEMIVSEFAEQLNVNRGSNTDWLEWEIGDETAYPVFSKYKNIANMDITVQQTSYLYDGAVKKPSVLVKDGEIELENDIDYTLFYENNKNVGTATVTITGKGNYTGSIEKTFTIKKGTQKIKYTGTYKKAYNAKPFTVYAKRITGDGKLSYKSSNTKVATVNSKGKVTIKKAGTAVITVTAASTKNYNKKSVKITIQVAAKKNVRTSGWRL